MTEPAGPNASERFRAQMSHLGDISESRDAAQAEFLQKESERSSHDPRAVEAEAETEPVETEPVAAEPGEEVEAEPVEVDAQVEGEVQEEPEATPEGEVVALEDGSEVPLAELVKGHLRQADYTQKTQALAEERSQFDAQRQQVAAQAQEGMERLAGMAQALEVELAKYRPTPQQIEDLRQTDPGQAALLIEDDRRQRELIQMAQAEQDRIAREQQQAVIPQQRAALVQANPAFAENFDAEYQGLGEYAISPDGGGLRRDEWDQLVDHRHVNLVWKAREYDKATRNAKRLPKKLANVPKVLRPGSPRDARDTQSERYSAALANQAAKGGTFESTLEAFRQKEKLRGAR